MFLYIVIFVMLGTLLRRQKLLDLVMAGIPRIEFTFSFCAHAILIY